jgi:hypothetical protein
MVCLELISPQLEASTMNLLQESGNRTFIVIGEMALDIFAIVLKE